MAYPNGTDTFELRNYITSITSLYAKLAGYESFEPTEDLMDLYGSIQKMTMMQVTPSTEEAVFSDPQVLKLIPNLREKWGNAAGALEESWANKVLAAPDAAQARLILSRYPRLKNYHSTCPLELGLVTTVLGRPPVKLAMVGCGPLPLTGLTYMEHAQRQNYKLDVINIDIVEERVKSAERLCSLIETQDGMTFATADGRAELRELQTCDVVLLASVAGVTDDDKLAMIGNISKQMLPGSIILTRSSSGLSRLLYPRLDVPKLQSEFPNVKPQLQAIALNGPTKHDIYLLQVE